MKCIFFVVISMILFENKYLVDATAIVAHVANYFPVWSGYRNNDKSFISIIFTGCLLDPITGISMICAYLFSAYSFGYTSIAITSSMLVGIIKTFIHIAFFNNNDYIEAVFFIFFGILSIYKNYRLLMYVCAKSVKKDVIFVRLWNRKTTVNNATPNVNHNFIDKKQQTLKKSVKKSNLYKNYKKFYTNNRKFTEDDRLYDN